MLTLKYEMASITSEITYSLFIPKKIFLGLVTVFNVAFLLFIPCVFTCPFFWPQKCFLIKESEEKTTLVIHDLLLLDGLKP